MTEQRWARHYILNADGKVVMEQVAPWGVPIRFPMPAEAGSYTQHMEEIPAPPSHEEAPDA